VRRPFRREMVEENDSVNGPFYILETEVIKEI